MAHALRRGFTLVEMLVTVLITVILLGVVGPSFIETLARVRLEGVVNELGVDLQYARSASIRRQAGVTLVTSAEGNFYTINSGNLVLKIVMLPVGVALTSNTTVDFDPLRGTASATSLEASNTRLTQRLRATTNAMGRVQLCSPNGSFAGYATC